MGKLRKIKLHILNFTKQIEVAFNPGPQKSPYNFHLQRIGFSEGKHFNLTCQIWTLMVKGGNAEPFMPDRENVHLPTAKRLHLRYLCGAANGIRHSIRPQPLHFCPRLNEQHPKRLTCFEALIDHQLITFLEDMQTKRHSGEQD